MSSSNTTNGTGSVLNNQEGADAVAQLSGASAGTFAGSLVTSIVVFAVQAGLFVLIKDRFARI